MTHVIKKFGTIELPLLDLEQDISTGRVISSLIDAGNARAFNFIGTDRKLPTKQLISCRGIYHHITENIIDESSNNIVDESSNNLITGTPINLLLNDVYKIRAAVGTYKKLWIEELNSATLSWKNSRLLEVNQQETTSFNNIWVPLNLIFETAQEKWKAEDLTTSSTSLSSGSTVVQLSNSGRDSVNDAVITVTSTTGTVSSTRIRTSTTDLTWTSNIALNKSLVIDCGKLTVEYDGQDAWNELLIDNSHVHNGFLTLNTGITPITVTVDNDCTFKIEYYEQWS